MFDLIKRWYPDLWSKKMVADAVSKGKITPEQYEDITGEVYEGAV